VDDRTSNDTHSLELAVGDGSEDNIRFMIDGNVLRLKQNEVVDFEFQPEYGIRIRAIDAVGSSVESELTVFVNDLPEPASTNSSLSYFDIGITVLQIWGNQPGQYDQINSLGQATLGGTLVVQFVDGYVPTPADSFVLITATEGMTGTFDQVSLPTAPSGFAWNLITDVNELRMELVSGPTVSSVIVGNGRIRR
jgi:hypothetical protein